jgi:hypothetical protein
MKLARWKRIASAVFPEPRYRIFDHTKAMWPSYAIHYRQPRKNLKCYEERLGKITETETNWGEQYNSLMKKINCLNGHDYIVYLRPLEDRILVSSPTVYARAYRLARKLEMGNDSEITLKTTYERD